MVTNIGFAYLSYKIGSHFPSKSLERILSIATLSLMSLMNTIMVLRWFEYEILWKFMVTY